MEQMAFMEESERSVTKKKSQYGRASGQPKSCNNSMFPTSSTRDCPGNKLFSS